MANSKLKIFFGQNIVHQPQIQWSELKNKNAKSHYCFCHFTCAIDTETIIIQDIINGWELLPMPYNTHIGTTPRPQRSLNTKNGQNHASGNWVEYNVV